jgi:hypothetical protein
MGTVRAGGHSGGSDQCAARLPQSYGQTEPIHQLIGYYHQLALDRYGVPADMDAPHPPAGEPTEVEANQYLEVLKDAMGVHIYFPQQNASNGLEVFRDIEMRNRQHSDSEIELI